MAISITTAGAPPTPIVVFSDVNLTLNEESQYEIVYDEDSIQKSVTMIMGTKVGSRVFRRNFGSALEDLLFEPMDDVTVQRIKSELLSSIGKWETRIVLVSAIVKPDYANEQYYVALNYEIPALNNRSASFVFNLSRGGV
jgi:phage baseplate assembly protein W